MRFHTMIFMGMVVGYSLQAQTWDRISPDSLEVGWGTSGESSADVIYARGQLVYMGTTMGLFRSSDGGTNWQKLGVATRLPDSVINAIAASPVSPTLYVSIGYKSFASFDQSSSLYRSSNGGDSWESIVDSTVVPKPNVADVVVSALNPDFVLALQRSPGPGAGNLDQILRSADGGLTWIDVSSGSFSTSSHGVRIEIGSDPTDSAKHYATGDTQFDVTFYVSENSGLTWTPKSTPSIGTSRELLSFAGDLLYLVGAGAAVYSSSDGGSSWLLDQGLDNSDRYLYKLAIHPNSPAIMLAATSDGLWLKNSILASWSRIAGLPPGEYYDVFVDSLTGTVYAGGDQGLFRIDGVTSAPQEPTTIPSQFHVDQNYPNPFNPTTVIKYTVPVRTFVRLVVYDVLGKSVGTLVEAIKEAGTYNVVFNAADLQSGVYFYRLTADNYFAVKKMLLLR